MHGNVFFQCISSPPSIRDGSSLDEPLIVQELAQWDNRHLGKVVSAAVDAARGTGDGTRSHPAACIDMSALLLIGIVISSLYVPIELGTYPNLCD
ncbi:hypothetical protein RR46_00075 [Papilio xuthus]|uniref:Uncharacterized protein n=1 Tax=Papilio xuthus TaxID=66420 RepID=A0A0N1IJ06_PAPXU|nr:hypothetical protein RR46_00075 [Papilio xuthus]